MNLRLLILHLTLTTLLFSNLEAQDSTAITEVVLTYNQGFNEGAAPMIREAIGPGLMMVNGNFSGDPIDWQAHQFLSGKEIEEWISMMLTQAGPFQNQVEIIGVDIRNQSAVVVARESGRNAFRKWKDLQVTYFLGNIHGKWKINGYFVKDLKNPE